MIFTKRPSASVPKVPAQLAKPAKLTARKDEAARRKLADTDGTRRRALQLMEDNRLL